MIQKVLFCGVSSLMYAVGQQFLSRVNDAIPFTNKEVTFVRQQCQKK